MGVRGLQTYLERYNTAACYPVRIRDLIHEYRRNTNSTPIIVVNGMSIIKFIFKYKNLSWICGGQLKEYEQTLKDFIDAFHKEGAELVFFFNGPRFGSKREAWIDRRLDTLDTVYKLLDDFSSGVQVRKLEDDLEKISFSMVPSNTRDLTKLVAEQCGCKVYQSIRQCNLELAEYAFENKCLAIIAQDTDFVIFKSAKYYLSMKNYNFMHMTTFNYDRDKLASSIGIYSTDLPLLASLLGNDIVSVGDLRPFHQELLSTRGNNRKHFGVLIIEIARFIKFHVHSLHISRQVLETIAKKVFNDNSKWQLLEQSILSYDYSAEINRKPSPPTSDNENWKNVLKQAFELHSNSIISSTIYGIITQKNYTCVTGIEDYRLNDLPASQTLLKPLREKLYGILLFENPEPCEIEELVMCGPNSLDEAAYIMPKQLEVEHPGLLSLWRGNTTAQWSIIGEIFNVDSIKVRSLPGHLIIPALALRYLYGNIKFLAWELCALISSTVLLKFYEVNQLARLLTPEIKNTRPLRLHTIVSRSYSIVLLIFDAIGSPLSTEMISPSNYQDGKLFHLKYQEASRNCEVSEICEKKEEAVIFYESMMNFITENNQPVS